MALKHKTTLKRKAKVSKKAVIICVCIALAVCIIAASVGIALSSRSAVYYDFGKPRARGYDISEHNGDIDWDALKGEVDFVFIRVGYRGYGSGKICEDKNAKENLKGAKKAGIPFGVYFYTQATSEKEAQQEAAFVLKMLVRYQPQLPVVIDYEYPADENGDNTGRLWESALSQGEATKTVRAFCDKVEKHGYLSGVYASSYMYNSVINTKKLGKSTVVWVAEYNESVSTDAAYNIWQYSRTGKSDSVESKYVDLDYWYKTKQK